MTADVTSDRVDGPAVYVIASPNGDRKVGFTSKIDRRVGELAQQVPWPVKLELSQKHPLARQIEVKAHKILSDASTHGEWFSCSLERIESALAMATLSAEREAKDPPEPVIEFVSGWSEAPKTECKIKALAKVFGHGDAALGRRRICALCNVGSSTISMWKTRGIPNEVRALIYTFLLRASIECPDWLLGDIETPSDLQSLDAEIAA